MTTPTDSWSKEKLELQYILEPFDEETADRLIVWLELHRNESHNQGYKYAVEDVREGVTEYVKRATKDPESDNYIYADMIPLSNLDSLLSHLDDNK